MERRLQPERMDDLDLDPGLHGEALQGLERINRFSRSPAILWPSLARCFRDFNVRSLRALDIATGAGDVPIRLWHLARRAGWELQIDGCDRSPVAIEHARRRAHQAGAKIRFFTHDPLVSGIPQGYDVLLCSLFLHHLSPDQAQQLLRLMGWAAARMVAVNDLVRGRAGLALAAAGTRILSRSPIVHADGVSSVRAAFTMSEVRTLAQSAGLSGCSVSGRWPCRFLLTWMKPDEN